MKGKERKGEERRGEEQLSAILEPELQQSCLTVHMRLRLASSIRCQ